MGKFFASFTVMLLLTFGLSASDLPARVTAVEGPVHFEQGEGAEWAEVTLYHSVRASDRYLLQEGAYLEIELNDGSFARLGPKSDIVVEELSLEFSRLTLYEGALILRTEADSFVTVAAGQVQASVRGVGLARVEITPQGKVNVTSRFGTVELNDGIRTRTLSRGQHLELSSNGLLASTLGFGFPLDELDQWSDERDARLVASAEGAIYGGESITDYLADSGDLAYGNHGALGGYAGYGQSWFPYFGFGRSAFHPADFRFYPGLGFGFCAFQPWGFSPAFAWNPYHSHYTSHHWVYVRPLSRWCRMSSFFDWRHNRFGFRPRGTTWAGPGPGTPGDTGAGQPNAPVGPPGFVPPRPLEWTAARSLDFPLGQAFVQNPAMRPVDSWIPFVPENPAGPLTLPAERRLRGLEPISATPVATAPYPRIPSEPVSSPASASPAERPPAGGIPTGDVSRPATRTLAHPAPQPQNPTVIVIPRRAAPETPSASPTPRALTPPSRERSPKLAPPENRPTPQIQRFPSRERVYPNPEPQGRPLIVVPRQAQPERPATAPPQRSLNPPARDRSPGLSAPQNRPAPQIRRPSVRPTPQVQRPQQRPAPQVRPMTPQRRPVPQIRPQPRPTPPRPAAQPAQQRRPQERSGRPPE